jgi:hypothetical protein
MRGYKYAEATEEKNQVSWSILCHRYRGERAF